MDVYRVYEQVWFVEHLLPFFRLSLTWLCPEARPRNRVASFGQVAPGQLLLDPLEAALEVSALVLVPLSRLSKNRKLQTT